MSIKPLVLAVCSAFVVLFLAFVVLFLLFGLAGVARLVDSGAQTPRPSNGMEVALLPSALVDHDIIAELTLGGTVWTVPWAMTVFEDSTCWLNRGYSFHRERFGTSRMKVERTERGYVVTVPHNYRYQPKDGIPWFGADESDLIPVLKVLVGDWSY